MNTKNKQASDRDKQIMLAAEEGQREWLVNYLKIALPELDKHDVDYQVWFDNLLNVFKERNLINPKQQKNPITSVCNAIKTLDVNHPALEIVKFSSEIWNSINDEAQNAIADRSNKLLDNPDAIVNKAIELIESNDWSDIAAGLAVVTGRRCGEVVEAAELKYKTEYSVIFRGALKRKGAEISFEIPTLCNANLVIKSLNILRNKLSTNVENISSKEFDAQYKNIIANKCDRHFSDLVPKREGRENLYTHLFRAVYAAIASHWYCPVCVIEMDYRATIQGHYKILEEKDEGLKLNYGSSRNYFDYRIGDGFGNIDGRLGIKLGLDGVEVIERFKEKYLSHQFLTTNTSKPNSLPEPKFFIPIYFNKIEQMANLLNLSQSKTINLVVDWAQAAMFLGQDLNLDSLTPEGLITYFKELEQTKSSDHKSINAQSRSISEKTPSALLEIIYNLSHSLDTLTKTLEKPKKIPRFSNNNYQTTKSSTKKRNRDRNEVMAKDINHGIDAIMDFNDTPGRPHKQKFSLAVKAIYELTGRSSTSIAKVLKTRSDEIKKHNEEHELTKYHNKSRRDEYFNYYPRINEEEEINYQKITEVGFEYKR